MNLSLDVTKLRNKSEKPHTFSHIPFSSSYLFFQQNPEYNRTYN